MFGVPEGNPWRDFSRFIGSENLNKDALILSWVASVSRLNMSIMRRVITKPPPALLEHPQNRKGMSIAAYVMHMCFVLFPLDKSSSSHIYPSLHWFTIIFPNKWI